MFSNRRESVGRPMARKQSSSGPPTMELVSVAVLPPNLPRAVGPPHPTSVMDIGWDEGVNYEQNNPINEAEPTGARKYLRKAGFTTQRKRANSDKPPFIFRQVPYDTWRKHYAKDAEGNYRGTRAPAEDCLLLPSDVTKWRVEPMTTIADRWTRGSEALPVYDEVQASEAVPSYEDDYTGPPPGERTLSNLDSIPDYDDDDYMRPPPGPPRNLSTSSAEPGARSSGEHQGSVAESSTAKIIANGKTAQEIIEEAKRKQAEKPKPTWKENMKRGVDRGGSGAPIRSIT